MEEEMTMPKKQKLKGAPILPIENNFMKALQESMNSERQMSTTVIKQQE